MQSIWQDVRYSVRGLLKQPGFTVLAVVTLALGIGAGTTIFSVIHAVLLDPLPYADADRVVNIQIRDTGNSRLGAGGRGFLREAEFLDYQAQSTVFEEVIGGGFEDTLLTTNEGTLRFQGAYVTPNTFTFLRVAPLYGRGVMPDDAKPGAPPVFVMSHKMWMAHHGGDPSVLGRTYVLNGVPTTLVGIMPPRFTKLAADLWRPRTPARSGSDLSRPFFMFQARLKPGVTLEQASAELDAIAHRVAPIYRDDYPKQFKVVAVRWLDNVVGPFRTTLYTLAAAVGLLLLIACSNVANMLLARAAAREKEMAIRTSLGASRGRLVRQLLIESLWLAGGGAMVGGLLAYGGVKLVVSLTPDGLIPREAVIALDVPALLFSLALAVLTALLFGLAPAMQTARRDMVEPLKDSGKGVSGRIRSAALRDALVVIEVALSLMLLVGAGLLMRSFIALQHVDLGLNPKNVLVARLPLPRGQYTAPGTKQQFFAELLRRLHALPGVVVATETSTLPPYGGIGSEVDIPGKTHTERWDAIYQLCSEGYFPTLGLRLLRGRLLTAGEVNTARRVAVVNETLAIRYLGTQEPLGRHVRVKGLETLPEGKIDDAVFEIVGVVADARNQGIRDPPSPELFIPYTVTNAFERGILVRTSVEPESLLNSVRREIWDVDRNVALTLTGTLEGYLRQFSYMEPRFTLALLGAFAALGLVLVGIGVYSVIAYIVSRQTHEIGIRMALGASRADVLRMVVGRGVRLLAIGIAIGMAGSLGAVRLIGTQIWGISQYDPLTLITVVAVMALAGLAACYTPARRAARVDPIVALRFE
jgi:putative ABC transport system permease protein